MITLCYQKGGDDLSSFLRMWFLTLAHVSPILPLFIPQRSKVFFTLLCQGEELGIHGQPMLLIGDNYNL